MFSVTYGNDFTAENGQKVCVYRFTAGYGGLGLSLPYKEFFRVSEGF